MCTCGQDFVPFEDAVINEIMLPTNALFGCGMSCYDVNQDGYDDLTIGGKNTSLRLFLNDNGSFNEHDLGLSYPGEVKSVLWADIDNDGDADLFVSVKDLYVKLYENIGDLNLVDITASAGIPAESTENWGAAWGDVNADGYLDLYLCKYANHNNGELTYDRMNHLYLNNGNNTFTDITIQTETQDGVKLSFLPLFWDYDKDGDQDIYVINDKTYRNTIFKNDGDLNFSDAALSTNLGVVMDAMSISPGDWNHDGHDDIYITNTFGGNALFSRNSEEASYMDIASDHDMEVFQECWSANWLDHDNNGDLDLYVVSSGGIDGGNPNRLFVQENGSFVSSSLNENWLDSPWSYASGIFDINNDGFTDIANYNSSPYPFSVWQNTPNENHFLKLDLEGTLSNREAIGTHIELFAGGTYQYRYTHCGEAYLTQNSQYEIFGLDTCTVVDSLVLTWLSGTVDKFYDLPSDQFLHIHEGGSLLLSADLEEGWNYSCEGDSIQLCLSGFSEYAWSDGSIEQCRSLHPGNNYTAFGLFNGIVTDSLVFMIDIAQVDQPEVSSIEPLCHGENSGLLEIQNSEALSVIEWSTGSEEPSIDSLYSGWYSLHIQNSFGCPYDTLLFLNEPPPFFLGSIIAQPTEFEPGSAFFSPIGGTPPYSIEWNNGSELWFIYELTAGDYSLIASDANGCKVNMDFEIISIVSDLTVTKSLPQFYPNPTNGALRIDLEEFDMLNDLKCFDARGNDVTSNLKIGWNTVELSSCSPGIYVFKWRTNSGTYRQLVSLE